FFFQAEDGIRALTVTEVPACALPIPSRASRREPGPTTRAPAPAAAPAAHAGRARAARAARQRRAGSRRRSVRADESEPCHVECRSEERRVGKECRWLASTGTTQQKRR